ncbi:hypothetical protein DOY81_011911 [Sarcophaga bullata]|nr:hypothetical protein DOY81_011911 [Sarcophaga bullata]
MREEGLYITVEEECSTDAVALNAKTSSTPNNKVILTHSKILLTS